MLTCPRPEPAWAGSNRMSGFILDFGTLPTGASRVVLESGAIELDLPSAEWPETVRGEFGVERNGERSRV